MHQSMHSEHIWRCGAVDLCTLHSVKRQSTLWLCTWEGIFVLIAVSKQQPDTLQRQHDARPGRSFVLSSSYTSGILVNVREICPKGVLVVAWSP